MTALKNKAKIHSFWFSLLYVGIGTTMLLIRTNPDSDIIQTIQPLILLVTMPVIFIAFGIFYGGGQEVIVYVILIQISIFFVFWYIAYRFLLNRYKKDALRNEYMNVKEFFNETSQDNFEIDKIQAWRFFFRDDSRESLMKLYNKLKAHEYSLDGLKQSDSGMWILEISKKEILSLQSFAKRNMALIALIDKYDVQSYEGWTLKSKLGQRPRAIGFVSSWP